MNESIISHAAARTACGFVFASLMSIMACHRPAPAALTREQVVFVCEHGAAKSVVAAAYFNKLATERGLSVRAIARGADPQAEPSVSAVAGLRDDGLAASPDLPKPLRATELRGSTRIVAFDCGQPAMKVLRGMDACWDDVPATGDGYAAAREAIRTHVAAMVDELAARGAGSTLP